jgi:apolipoprotein N-acyltransferase
VKHPSANSILRSRYPVAIVAGLMLAAAFPKIGIAGFAWIAPALMLAAALGKSGWEAFRLGYVAGLVYYLVSLYWVLLIPYRWHSIPLGPAAGWLALSGFVALYPATWVWLMSQPASSPRARSDPNSNQAQPSVSNPHEPPWESSEVVHGVLARSWVRRSLWALSGATSWVALEMILARFLSGFPWDLLGASQHQMLPLIQIASVTGIYGVSFLVVWFSLSLLSAALMVLRRPTMRSVWVGEILVPTLVITALFNYGFRQIRRPDPPTERSLNLSLIQPSIPQTLIWDSTKDEERFQDLLRLSRQALTNRTDILIWPEAAVPKLLRFDRPTYEAITGLARDHHVWMIIGADDAEPRPGAANMNEADFYNSSFLISPQGKLVETYRKRNLVIFGEYVPLVRWLPFLKWFTPIDQGYSVGTNSVPFVMPDLHVTTSVLICFEDLFPHLARRSVDDQTDFLVNLTNNGWFDESAAQWQHATGALFRAVENGLPLIRCSNNGISCWVDDRGQLRETFRDRTGTIYGPGFLTAQIPLPVVGVSHPKTFYHSHGDWFGWACVGLAGLRPAARCFRPRRTE